MKMVASLLSLAFLSTVACDLGPQASCESYCESDDECDYGLSCISVSGRNMCLPEECSMCSSSCGYSTNEYEVQTEGALFQCEFSYCN